MSAHVVIGGRDVRRSQVRAVRLSPDLALLHPSEAGNPPWDRVALWCTTHTMLTRFNELTGALSALGFWWYADSVDLTPERLAALEGVVQQWKTRYPDAVPALLGDEAAARPEQREHIIACGVLLRLVWLLGACRLAVKRCKRPALRIS